MELGADSCVPIYGAVYSGCTLKIVAECYAEILVTSRLHRGKFKNTAVWTSLAARNSRLASKHEYKDSSFILHFNFQKLACACILMRLP